MRMSDAYPSRFLSAADITQPTLATITYVEMEAIGQEGNLKPVLHLDEFDKSLVLNKTNFRTLAGAFGDETDNWRGRQIVLFTEMVPFKGQLTKSIRVRLPKSKQQEAAPARPDLDDTIPF